MGDEVPRHCAQYHRTAEIGRNISPLSAANRATQSRLPPDPIHVAHEYFQGRRLQHTSEQPVPGLTVLAVK